VAALLIAAAMVLYGRIVRWRLFEGGAIDAPAGQPAIEPDPIRASALLSAVEIGMVFISMQQRVVFCNPAFLRIWKVPPNPGVIGAGLEQLLAVMGGTLARPGERSRFLMRAPYGDETQAKLDLPMADGRLVTQQSYSVNDAADTLLGRMWVFEDVTIERRNARQLVQLAERDALTGQYNRRRFNEEIARMTADAQRNGTRLALLFLDLDGFKHINDTYGHRAGDATLIRVAGEVSGQVRRNEIFARLGGDEFAILAPDAVDDVLQVLAERVTRSVSQTQTEFEGQRLQLTCSCGIAVYPDNAKSPDDLMACADAAMYQAKEAGKNTWRFYRSSSDTTQPAVSPLSPEGRIRHAFDNNLLVLHYQGIYATRERSLTHYEVLLRVRDPERPGVMLLTSEFIEMAEKSDKIIEIDRWVLSQAIQKLAAEDNIPAFAVNISGRSLDDDLLPAFIENELKRNGVSPQRLLVELTETAAVSDLHDARRFIEALQNMGCGVSLDDFGTGFSSFAYLKHLHVDSIKIDGLFIRDLAGDRENQLFVRAIVSVARGLHKTTIAECVEDEATLKILATLGVDYVQGNHLEVPHAVPTGISAAPAVAARPKRISAR
ncbi:MAG TPA: EAL domain-containing protein, partial [Burkholderiales bacterium]|nr:EAL domain-containing protein [Burkholderiales bacterium]